MEGVKGRLPRTFTIDVVIQKRLLKKFEEKSKNYIGIG